MHVSVRAHARQARIDATRHETACLVQHALRDHVANAPLDRGDKDLARRAEADPERRQRCPADARYRTARDGGDLEVTNESPPVTRIHT